MLVVTNLDKSFDGNLIFKNLSFSVQDGDKVAVVGLNGAGKSTLFRIFETFRNRQNVDVAKWSVTIL